MLIGVQRGRRRAARRRAATRRRGRGRRATTGWARPARRRCARPGTSWSGSTAAAADGALDAVERLGVRPVRLASGLTAEDAALLLADAAGASVLVGVGCTPPSRSSSTGSAPGWPAPTSPGSRSAPAWSTPPPCPQLYSGRVRPWHLLLVLLAGLVAVAAAVGGHPGRPAVGRLAWPTSPRTVLVMSFRYHVVSLVAVLLALAAGVALGGGPLTELGRAAPAGPSAADVEAAAQAQRAADFGDEVVSGAADRLYGDGLDGGTVAVVVMPGTPQATVQAVSAEIGAAGGTVVGTYAVEPALVAAGEKALVDTLGSQLMTQLDDGRCPDRRRRPTTGWAGCSGWPWPPARPRPARRPRTPPRSGRAWPEPSWSRPWAPPAERRPYVVVLLGEDSDAAEDPIYAGLLDGLAEQAGRRGGRRRRRGRCRRPAVAAARADTCRRGPRWTGSTPRPGRVTALLALTEWPETRGRRLRCVGCRRGGRARVG